MLVRVDDAGVFALSRRHLALQRRDLGLEGSNHALVFDRARGGRLVLLGRIGVDASVVQRLVVLVLLVFLLLLLLVLLVVLLDGRTTRHDDGARHEDQRQSEDDGAHPDEIAERIAGASEGEFPAVEFYGGAMGTTTDLLKRNSKRHSAKSHRRGRFVTPPKKMRTAAALVISSLTSSMRIAKLSASSGCGSEYTA